MGCFLFSTSKTTVGEFYCRCVFLSQTKWVSQGLHWKQNCHCGQKTRRSTLVKTGCVTSALKAQFRDKSASCSPQFCAQKRTIWSARTFGSLVSRWIYFLFSISAPGISLGINFMSWAHNLLAFCWSCLTNICWARKVNISDHVDSNPTNMHAFEHWRDEIGKRGEFTTFIFSGGLSKRFGLEDNRWGWQRMRFQRKYINWVWMVVLAMQNAMLAQPTLYLFLHTQEWLVKWRVCGSWHQCQLPAKIIFWVQTYMGKANHALGQLSFFPLQLRAGSPAALVVSFPLLWLNYSLSHSSEECEQCANSPPMKP